MFLPISWVILQVVGKDGFKLVIGWSLKVCRIEYHLIFISCKCLTVEPDISFALRDEGSQLASILMICLKGLDLNA
jgi:hypothetical protein